ncbi:GIY-YIG nuclease family protein [Chryseobacterium sp. EO14]|uniref:GIY-YIG nuclease family protein n=1 Tax=Chryseobacterium sp. EO14 TaxID=2950551 RepID=UPI00210EE64F|nr:GIY-YIG nuclease family protein [Chryseobacterium sp. EO14]MCQ4139835.1 GIY-YIG nuclease family protein [Chryseobacterium sp. EO14]
MFGKTIKIFLIDGEPNGRLTCELSNWTGKAFRIPRNKIKISADRSELENTGIYILFGKSTDNNKDLAYIGEGEEIYKRITQHISGKDFWNEVIVFISKDDNLNKAHIKYLENRLYETAKKVNRYDLVNSNIPTKPSISESDRAEMEEFAENIKLLTNTLGYKIFEELIHENQTFEEQEKNTFYIRATRGANAKGQITNEGFVVLKGSQIADTVTTSLNQSIINFRQRLIDEQKIINTHNKLIFTEDYLFSSPSTAAAIVMGRSANGLTEWKLSDGRILKSIEI